MLANAISAIVFGLNLVVGQPQAGTKPEDLRGLNVGLINCISRMVKIDQALREELTKLMREGSEKGMPELVHKLEAVDRDNTNQMRQIVKTYGWPTPKLVGKRGSELAWLLVQHADLNPGFQRECLDLMTPLLPKGEVSKSNYAYLTDRVLLAEGKKQRYGSQFHQNAAGVWEPKPLEDPDTVDKRRAEMGMGPISEYKKMIEEMYGKKPPHSS